MTDPIKTKLLFEYSKGQLLGLGFGNIVNSEADIVCVSAFAPPSFNTNSSIGALSAYVQAKFNYSIERQVVEELKSGSSLLIAIPNKKRKLLIVCMGNRNAIKEKDAETLASYVSDNLKIALEDAKIKLSRETEPFSIDITALGSRYGGLRRKESFDLVINWTSDLFATNSLVNLIRLIALDLDTFVDFFESLYRMQKFKTENQLTISSRYNPEDFAQFKGEINSALRSLDDNPRGVIVTCRLIIEMVVKTITKQPNIKLADGILSLKETVPPNIFSYLTTCRVIGNFSHHDPNFEPTRRDAEGILLLTLRIVEWHLSIKSTSR